MTEKLVSKVLVLENEPRHLETIRSFCDENNLVGLKVRKNRLMSVLRSNIDLGAILLAENYGSSREASDILALQIHTMRPELPIILRRDVAEGAQASLEDVGAAMRNVCCAAYTIHDMSTLARLIDEYIFSVDYPNALVRGVSEITEAVFATQFKGLTSCWTTPHIVRDRIIFGEVFSLIPLESAWCRGYMMLQAEEDGILAVMGSSGTIASLGFRDVNSLLGEITNLIWGAFKNRYVGDASATAGCHVQVPLIVNHKHKYISFGTETPQLCFSYTLTDEASGKTVRLLQRFIFNLNWTPEEFREIVKDPGELVAAGELEFF